VEEVSEAFAATRGLTMPSQLRRMLRAQGRDLHAEFLRLLPAPPRPIAIQRFSARRLGLTLAVLVGTFLAVVLVLNNLSGLGLTPPPPCRKTVLCEDLLGPSLSSLEPHGAGAGLSADHASSRAPDSDLVLSVRELALLGQRRGQRSTLFYLVLP
jgi:hypothetical protein